MATLTTTYPARTLSPAAQLRQRTLAPHLWLLGFCVLFAVGVRVVDLDRSIVADGIRRHAADPPPICT